MEFTNSGLVSYTRIAKESTKNHFSPRTKAICRISPHVMAGNLSVEACGNLFAKTGKNASSNYGIGTDGRIAMYVEERYRSWCTSSADNDQQAVTIEIANNGGAPDWPVSEMAWRSLILLCIDICRRNGKDVLLWLEDKNETLAYKPKDNEMILTVHRWFAAKSCCGPYVLRKLKELADSVNAELKKSPEAPPEDIEETPLPATVTDEKYLWDALDALDLNDFSKAGIMANIFAESGLQSNNLQNTYERKLGMTDQQYTAAVDSGSYTAFNYDSAGYGIAQWTHWSRKENLYKFMKSKNLSIGDFRGQVEFLVDELKTSYKSLLTLLKHASNVRAASDWVLEKFEVPGVVVKAAKSTATAEDKKNLEEVQIARANYATHFYNMYAVQAKIPYTVRVTCDVLNIRAGAGTDTAKTGKKITDRGIYTIIEEKTGAGANLWGKLMSGAGWISLDYTVKT